MYEASIFYKVMLRTINKILCDIMVADKISGYCFVRIVGPALPLDSAQTRGKAYTNTEIISFEVERIGIPENDILVRTEVLDKSYTNIYKKLSE